MNAATPHNRRLTPPVARRLRALGSGYSRFVRITKYLLPVIALMLASIVFMRLTADPQLQTVTALPEEEKTVPGQIELITAKYEGVDAEGRAYTLMADKAVRDMTSANAVNLQNPKADMTLTDDTWVAIHADRGRYDNTTMHLALAGNIRLFHDSGYEMFLQEMDIDLRTRNVVSGTPVTAQGPAGTLQAAGLDISSGGDLIVFRGPGTLRLQSGAFGRKRG